MRIPNCSKLSQSVVCGWKVSRFIHTGLIWNTWQGTSQSSLLFGRSHGILWHVKAIYVTPNLSFPFLRFTLTLTILGVLICQVIIGTQQLL